MRGWAWTLGGAALALSLLLPWFYGTDDGRSLAVAGWDTEPGFTLGVLASACGIAVAGLVNRPRIAMLSAVTAIALCVWMLPRGERYSGYDLGPGAFVALAVGAVALAAAAHRMSGARAATRGERQLRLGRCRAQGGCERLASRPGPS